MPVIPFKQRGDVFPDNVKFEIDDSTCSIGMKNGIFVSIGNDGYGKFAVRCVYNRQTCAVNTDGTFVHQDIIG